jgi:hypothetical protein
MNSGERAVLLLGLFVLLFCLGSLFLILHYTTAPLKHWLCGAVVLAEIGIMSVGGPFLKKKSPVQFPVLHPEDAIAEWEKLNPPLGE